MKHARPLGFVAAVASLLLAACSQLLTTQPPRLEPQFGTADRDIGVAVAPTSDGGATSLSFQSGRLTGDKSDYTYTYAVVRRYDASGALLWNSFLGLERLDGDVSGATLSPRAIFAGPQGTSLVLLSRNGIYNDSVSTSTHKVVRYSASGGAVGEFTLGTTGQFFEKNEPYSEHFNAVAISAEGNGTLYAAFEVIDLEDLSYYNNVSKYTPTGTLIWQRQSTVGTPYGAAITPNGFYVIGKGGLARYSSGGGVLWTKTGTSYRVGAYAKLVAVGSNLVARTLDVIRKYDANGNLLWSKNQTGLNTLVIQDVSADSGGNLYLSGKFDAGGGNFNAFVRKLSPNGTTLWTKTYGTPNYDDARGVTSVSGSTIFVAGETQGPLAGTYQGGESDAYLRRLNASGNPVWTR